jgi:hypothetical protein
MVGGWADVVAWGILLSILFSMLNVTTAWWAVSGILSNQSYENNALNLTHSDRWYTPTQTPPFCVCVMCV